MHDRTKIAWNYLTGWFLIDLIAIVPFEVIFSNGVSANMVRFTRIGRLNKVFKLMKLVRLIKLKKKGSFDLLNWLESSLNINSHLRWHFSFLFFFVLIAHVAACFWIISASLGSFDESWIVQQYGYD